MSNTLDFYADAGLATPAPSIYAVQSSDGSAAAVDRVVYLGSPAAAKRFLASSDPGVDQITVSIASGGAGVPASALRLALTQGGLDSSTPGAPLDVGVEIISGAGNAVPVHVRIDAGVLASGLYSNLTLATNETRELAVV